MKRPVLLLSVRKYQALHAKRMNMQSQIYAISVNVPTSLQHSHNALPRVLKAWLSPNTAQFWSVFKHITVRGLPITSADLFHKLTEVNENSNFDFSTYNKEVPNKTNLFRTTFQCLENNRSCDKPHNCGVCAALITSYYVLPLSYQDPYFTVFNVSFKYWKRKMSASDNWMITGQCWKDEWMNEWMNSIWVRALPSLIHLGLKTGPLCPIIWH
jgi:hypothetical protein